MKNEKMQDIRECTAYWGNLLVHACDAENDNSFAYTLKGIISELQEVYDAIDHKEVMGVER